MTHKELVEIGYKWLLQRCGFAFKELNAYTTYGEVPDVIGFRGDCSILLEAKMSRADFLADAKKLFRHYPWQGLGEHRFYICPEGLIKKEELPENWGLIYVKENGRIKVIHKAYQGNMYHQNKFERFDAFGERALMYSALRRLHIKNRLPEIYEGTPRS